MKSHNTLVIGWKDGKIEFIRGFNYETEEKEAQAYLKMVQESCDNWAITAIEFAKIEIID